VTLENESVPIGPSPFFHDHCCIGKFEGIRERRKLSTAPNNFHSLFTIRISNAKFTPNSTSTMNTPGQVLLAPSPDSFAKYDFMFFLKGAAAGGICCSVTHGALTPVDVVKTRVQLNPSKVGKIFLILSKSDSLLGVYRHMPSSSILEVQETIVGFRG